MPDLCKGGLTRVVLGIILSDNDVSAYEGYRSWRAEKMSLYP
ncbi:hypothetical protein [Marispirochaeta aestuarii]|nr:hypothetical protein [Marispirochaeta aestuarii]